MFTNIKNVFEPSSNNIFQNDWTKSYDIKSYNNVCIYASKLDVTGKDCCFNRICSKVGVITV